MEKHIDSCHVIQELFFSKKGVNCNHYINLLKVRFKVYKMCTLKETFRKVFDSNGSTSYARIYI